MVFLFFLMEALGHVYTLLRDMLDIGPDPQRHSASLIFPERFGLEIYAVVSSINAFDITVYMYGSNEPVFQARMNGSSSTLIRYDPGLWLVPVLEEVHREKGFTTRTRQ